MYDSVDEVPVEGHLSVDTRKVFASAALPKRDDTCAHQDNVIILTIILVQQFFIYRLVDHTRNSSVLLHLCCGFKRGGLNSLNFALRVNSLFTFLLRTVYVL